MSAAKTRSAGKAEKLAIEGGKPVRSKPLPLEFPGGHMIGREEIAAVTGVLKRKSPFRYYGIGKADETDRLEAEFAKFCRRKYALGVNSGTSALSICLSALGVGPGQEVALPGYFWVSCVAAVVRSGAIPVLVDVDETFCMDPEDLRRKITSRTRVALVVHMSGAPGRLDQILKIAQERNVMVLADCAQASGALWQGRPIGTYGDMAIFSFQLNKNMTTGEGGMIVCDDKHLYDRAFSCHDMGYARNVAGRIDPSLVRYQLWGQGSRMNEMVAAMARVQLRKLPKIVKKMNAAKYKIRKALADLKGIRFRTIMNPSGDSGAFLITIFPNGDICRRFVKALRAEGIRPPDVGCSNIPMTEWGLHIYSNNTSLVSKTSICESGEPWKHPANSESIYAYGKGTLPRLDDLVARSSIMSIPPVLTDNDVKDIIRAYRKVAAHVME